MNTLTPRQFLLVYAEKCPCHSEALPSCALCELHSTADGAERAARLAAMSDEQIETLYQRHLQCVNRVCGA